MLDYICERITSFSLKKIERKHGVENSKSTKQYFEKNNQDRRDSLIIAQKNVHIKVVQYFAIADMMKWSRLMTACQFSRLWNFIIAQSFACD